MKFGPVPVAQAQGAILAHSIATAALRLRKGRVLSASDTDALAAAGVAEVTVARLGPEDVPEDRAASRIAAGLVPDGAGLGVRVSAPFTGRVNLYAEGEGVLSVDAARVDRLNALDEAVTLATLPDRARVSARQMVGTVKIIPYAAPEAAVAAAERLAREAPLLRLNAPHALTATLILTRTPGMADKVLDKGAEAVRSRLAALGVALEAECTVAHEAGAVAAALEAAGSELLLILTASATSDRADVGPAGVGRAGGRLVRFGMPVDPGNLLFLGEIGDRPVIGLPGCARSPRLNGADWVLERLVCGLEVDAAAIAGMGVGGLLKEIPSRPAPRAGGGTRTGPEAPRRPRVSAVLLAAGSARRMRGADKLLELVDGAPLLRRLAERLTASEADEVLAVLRGPEDPRADALDDLAVHRVANPRAAEGMGTSIAAGLAALRADADAVILVLADMPEIGADDIDRLIAAFDPEEGREIVRATSGDGRPGHPVLFGRRFFEALAGLGGDSGAREILREHPGFVVDVALGGDAALTDLDTPEAWAAWRAGGRAAALSD